MTSDRHGFDLISGFYRRRKYLASPAHFLTLDDGQPKLTVTAKPLSDGPSADLEQT